MGRDKALLLHPGGGTWLEHSLEMLAALGNPVTLISGEPEHLRLATRLGGDLPVALQVLKEPPPREGPLTALHRGMKHHRGERLLLCAVDMPWLEGTALEDLISASASAPLRIHLPCDGQRLHPLPGLYPGDERHRRSLGQTLARGERGLLDWAQTMDLQPVPLPACQLANANRPADADRLWGSQPSVSSETP
jgi:molybdopterin-guanine dinucleotide biosynthesis protein A